MDLKQLILIFISVIVGLAFLTIIADHTVLNTDLSYDNRTNESHTMTTDWLGGDVLDESKDTITLTHGDRFQEVTSVRSLNDTLLSPTTDYTVTHDNLGNVVTIEFLNTTDVREIANESGENTTLVDYTQYPEMYVQGSGAARTILSFNSLWFVLAILMAVAGVVYMKYKDGTLF